MLLLLYDRTVSHFNIQLGNYLIIIPNVRFPSTHTHTYFGSITHTLTHSERFYNLLTYHPTISFYAHSNNNYYVDLTRFNIILVVRILIIWACHIDLEDITFAIHSLLLLRSLWWLNQLLFGIQLTIWDGGARLYTMCTHFKANNKSRNNNNDNDTGHWLKMKPCYNGYKS